MDYRLSAVQAQLQQDARRLFESELSPERVVEIEQSDSGLLNSLWDEAGRRGWSGILVADAFAGSGGSLLDLCVLLEEVGRAGAALPLVDCAGVAVTLLSVLPDGTVRDRCLADIAAGEIVVPALTDEEGRSEWDSIRLPMDAAADGFRISGSKAFVPYAASASVLLVTVVGPDGVPAVVAVDRSAHGVIVSRHRSNVGSPLFSVTFQDVRVSADQVLASGAAAVDALDAALNAGAMLGTAEAIGLCEKLLGISVDYVKVREAFGKPIGAFQAVAHACADIYMHIETIRILLHNAAWAAGKGEEPVEEIHATKALANELFAQVANDAFRVHGALGLSGEYELQIYTRRLQGYFQTFGETEDAWERAATALAV